MSISLLTCCRLPANASRQLLYQIRSSADYISSNKQAYSRLKPLLVLLLLFFFKESLMAQPAIQWDKTIGGNNTDNMASMQATADGGYILGGTSASGISGDKSQNSRGGNDYWIVKIAADGSKQWDKTFGGTGNDQLTTIQITSDGGYMLGGMSDSNAGGDKSENSRGRNDYWVVKLDSKGTKQWDKTIGGSEYDELSSLRQMPDGGYVLAGSSLSNISGDKTAAPIGSTDPEYLSFDFWIVKLTSKGSIEWDKTYGYGVDERITCMDLTRDGGFIVGGRQFREQVYGSYLLMKFKADGSKEWQKEVTPTGYGEIHAIQQTPDSGYILGGWSYSSAGGDQSESSVGGDYWIVKLDANREIEWDEVLGAPLDDEGNSLGIEELTALVQTSDGGYLLAGHTREVARGDKTENSLGGIDFWIVKIDSKGNILWDNTIGSREDDYATALCKAPDGGYLIGGYSSSNAGNDKTQDSKGGSDFWIVKLPPDEPQKTFTLSAQSLLFTYRQGSPVPPQTISVTSSTGMPELNFLKSRRSNWLTVPQASSSGSFSFSIDASYLAAGSYDATVTVFAQGYTRVVLPVKLLVVSEAAANTYLRINVGGDAYAASNGRQFKADQYYAGTDRTSSVTTGNILNTNDDALYRTGRCSPSFSYNIPVANGKVNVVLHFAEIWFKEAGKRKFHVNIEGSRKLTDYDIYARAGGTMRAVQQTIPVTVTDGMLNIDFLTGSADLPRISAIEVMVNSVTLIPFEDTYVRSGNYSYYRYGNNPNLDVKDVDGSPDAKRISYLRFSLGTAGQVGSAKLRLYGYNYENAREEFLHAYGVNNLEDYSWEYNFYYLNAPPAATPVLSSVGITNVAKYYELDVTSYVRAQQQAGNVKINFLLRDDNARNSRLTFNSKENTANPPQLVIQTVEEASAAARIGQQEIITTIGSEPEPSTVFPNPATKRFTVELSGKHSKNIDLDLINQNGQSYKIHLPEKARAGQKAEVDISNYSLSIGIYMLKIKSEAVTEVIKMLIAE